MKALLKQFIRTKRLSLGISETPNAYLRKSLQESEEDIKAGRVLSFGSAKDALKYLDKEVANDKRATH